MSGKDYLRLLLYFVLLLLCFSIQNTAGLLPEFFGAAPLLTAAFAYAAAVYDNIYISAATAAAAGVLTEVTLGGVIGPCTILLVLAGVLAGAVSRRLDSSALFAVLGGGLYSFVICAGVYFSGAVQSGVVPGLPELLSAAALRGAYTWIWCIIICLFFKDQNKGR